MEGVDEEVRALRAGDEATFRRVVAREHTGLVESHTLSRPVKRYDLQADYPRLVERLRASCVEKLTAAEIASRLNAEGFRPPKRAERFTRAMVHRLLWHLDLARREPHGRITRVDMLQSLPRRQAMLAALAASVAARTARAAESDRTLPFHPTSTAIPAIRQHLLRE